MAPGRLRIGKQRASSSSSYTSTITTVVFVALCVVGAWMLTSNSGISLRTTARATDPTTDDSTEDPAISSSEKVKNIEQITKKDQPAFEDNPGDLPTDAIKTDDPKSNNETDATESNDDRQEESSDSDNVDENSQAAGSKESEDEQEKQNEVETQEPKESSIAQSEQANEEKSESEGSHVKIIANQEQSASESGNNSEEPHTEIPDQIDQQDTKDKHEDVVVNDNAQDQQNQDSDGEQPQSNEVAASVDDIQDTQNTRTFEEQRQEEVSGVQSTPEESENELSDADQQQRIEEQKRKQEEGKQNTSLDKEEHQQQQEHDQQPSLEHAFDDATQQPEKETKEAESFQVKDKESQDHGNQNQEIKQDTTELTSGESSFPGVEASDIPKESKESKKSWSTQATQSENQKERRKDEADSEDSYGYTWELCNVTAGPDYIPCLDNVKALKQLRSTKHYEHRERHCPEEGPTCLVPLPQGFQRPIPWPQSRDKIWYHNVPHTKLAEVKGHQNWVKVTGEFLTFPGGGTQFIHGALHYIDFLQKALPNISWGNHTRVILDVGCGVASFGGYLFERDVLAMSFAPKDEHEAQVQFALERGIPAISAVMGSQRLPFPSMVFDLVHCARCRVPWHAEGGKLLLELNRVLRPGGYFVWSATPVYQKLPEDVEIWQAMSALTVSMCWELVTIKRDKLNYIGAAIYRKPTSNDCYDQRKKQSPPICKNDDDPNAAWYVPLQVCMHRVPTDETQRGARWPKEWPGRVENPPYWLNGSQIGIYGKPAPLDFVKDYEHWKHVVNKSYMQTLGISWSNVRNIMDMRAVYGGFAAALKDLKVWVFNVVNIDSPDTLPIIYERGLFGIYHDWCESFSTYPRTYDLLHADHLFSKLQRRCKLAPVMAEVDRILRPGGKLIVRDESSAIGEVESLLKSLRWEVQLTLSKNQEGILSAQKGNWRPQTSLASSR